MLISPEVLEAPEGQWVEPADYRKDLLIETLERLLKSMAMEVLAYCVMGNHCKRPTATLFRSLTRAATLAG